MTHPSILRRFHLSAPAVVLAAGLFATALNVQAQSVALPPPEPVAQVEVAPRAAEPLPEMVPLEVAPRRLRVGDATNELLALQRDGSVASKTARPITGDAAGRSYERYMKSFEHPIPEKFGTTVRAGSAGGSNSGGTTP